MCSKLFLLKFAVMQFPILVRHMTTARKKLVKIGCSSGFWGDTQTSAKQLVEKGSIDYLVSDYLSEVTMSLLTAAKQKDQSMGYAPDFVVFAIAPLIEEIKKKSIRIVSNAGGTNPVACANALQNMAKKVGKTMDIAVVLGDDIMSHKETLLKSESVKDMYSGKPLPNSITSMNVYFGAEPIKTALDMGAEVVITGRCVDSALVLAPLIHEFGWEMDDYHKLASGSLAGHLLECGAQVTGGIFTDWKIVPDWDNIGFPIAECYENGKFIITKPPSTGGLVSTATVAEQLIYEIGNPCTFLLPDVVCDFSNVNLTQNSKNSVLVQGAKGYSPRKQFKVCGTYLDGFRTTAVFSICGKEAFAKGRRTAESILKRVRQMFSKLGLDDFKNVNIHVFGEESMYGEHARKYSPDGARETIVRLAVEHDSKKALQLFSMEVAAAGTGMAPGLCGLVGGRPKINPVLKLFSFLFFKKNSPAYVHYKDKETVLGHVLEDEYQFTSPNKEIEHDTRTKLNQTNKEKIVVGMFKYRLSELAYARSGDKGNNCNIGVIARHPRFVPYIRHHVTTDVVFRYFKHLFDDENRHNQVLRYELPGISGFNFVLRNCLGGGGVASLRIDPQGKSYAQMLLDLEIENLPDLKVNNLNWS